MKISKNNLKSLAILLIAIGIAYYFIVSRNNKEGFEGENINMGQNIEDEVLQQYMNNSLDDLSEEEKKRKIATLRAKMAKFGLYPSAGNPDLSKYVLKTQLDAGNEQCTVATADDRDKYTLKSAIPEPKCPGVDLGKYVLKTSVQPDKICPPPKEIDYSRYVLKSTIPPAQKCPPCICPKVKVSAGLCKSCPPPPKAKCPEVKPCPQASCPEPRPCPVQEPAEKCHSIKYVKVPVMLKKTVQVNDRGEIVNQTEENVPVDANNNVVANSNGNGIVDVNGNVNGNGNVNINNVLASNETQDEIDAKNNMANNNVHNTMRNPNNTTLNNILPTSNSSELLNENNNAYNRSGIIANGTGQLPLSDTISSNLTDQNNASANDNANNVASINELLKNDAINNDPSGSQIFNANTRKEKNIYTPHFTGTLEKDPRNTKGNFMLANQPTGQGEKCGPVKFNNVFRKYGVYGNA
jgi:hypothetical protein